MYLFFIFLSFFFSFFFNLFFFSFLKVYFLWHFLYNHVFIFLRYWGHGPSTVEIVFMPFNYLDCHLCMSCKRDPKFRQSGLFHRDFSLFCPHHLTHQGCNFARYAYLIENSTLRLICWIDLFINHKIMCVNCGHSFRKNLYRRSKQIMNKTVKKLNSPNLVGHPVILMAFSNWWR